MEKAHERTNGQSTNHNSSDFHQSETPRNGYSGTFELDIIRNTEVQTFQVDEIMQDGAQGRI